MALPGESFDGKYRLLRVIGRGGMGVVFEARHEHLGKRVAIKVLRHEFNTDNSTVARFHREAQATAAIGHAGIVDIYDIGVSPEGELFLVMEYLDGVSYGEFLRERRAADMSLSVYVAYRTLSALGAAHDKGIVHRDLKPDNIFLIDNGQDAPEVKLLDFGISKFLNAAVLGEQELTIAGSIMGSPHYLSPEQARGQSDLDHRVDLYAMGVILFRSMTGHIPHQAQSYPELIHRIATDPVPTLDLERLRLPQILVETIVRALEKDPARRHQSSNEFMTELLPLVDPMAISGISLPGRIPVNLPLVQGTEDLAMAPTGVMNGAEAYGATPSGYGKTPVPATIIVTPPTGAAPGVLHEESSDPSPRRRRWVVGVVLMLAFASLGCFAVLGWSWWGFDLRSIGATAEESGEQGAGIVPMAQQVDAHVLSDGGVQAGDARADSDADLSGIADGGVREALGDASEIIEDAGQPSDDGGASEGGASADESSAITISVSTVPRTARIYVDNAAVRGNPFEGDFPPDGLSHRIRAEAPGYRPAAKVVVFDGDREVNIRLRRIRRGPRPGKQPGDSSNHRDPWGEQPSAPNRGKAFEERDPWD